MKCWKITQNACSDTSKNAEEICAKMHEIAKRTNSKKQEVQENYINCRQRSEFQMLCISRQIFVGAVAVPTRSEKENSLSFINISCASHYVKSPAPPFYDTGRIDCRFSCKTVLSRKIQGRTVQRRETHLRLCSDESPAIEA